MIFDFHGVVYYKTRDDRRALLAFLEQECGIARRDLRSEFPQLPKLAAREVVDLLQDRLVCRGLRTCEIPGLPSKQLIEDNVRLIRRLRPYYRIGLLANSDGSVEERLATFKLRQLFDSVIDSEVVGLRKPDPEAYHLAARELNCLPSQCVFIDDRPENVEGALAVGMKAVQFTWDAGDDLADQLASLGVGSPRRRSEDPASRLARVG